MKKCIAVMILFSVVSMAQDTTGIYQFPEVVVTATRSSIPLLDSPSPVDAISIDDRLELGGRNVADVLRSSSSVFIQDLGGPGALKTVFLRGTAPQHVLVLVNGVRQNSFQNGLVDFSLFPLSDVQRIEIVRGGSSALYGADALGGVVNILTRSAQPGLRLRMEGGAGSFGYKRWKLEGQGRPGPVGILAGVSLDEGTEQFPFQLTNSDPEMRRSNSDFQRRQAYLNGDAVIGKESYVRLFSQAVSANRGVPGPVSFPSDRARQSDEDATIGLELQTSSFRGTEISLKSAYRYGFQTYTDPNPSFPVNSVYRNGYVAFNPEVRAALGQNLKILIGGEYNEGVLTGSDFTGRVRRVQRAIYGTGEALVEVDRSSFDRLSLYGMVRYDDISDVGGAFMPKVGLNVRLLRAGDIRFRASYGSSFRSPSFNDLYYVGFSNPNLRPEHSTSFDAGVLGSIGSRESDHQLALTYFDLRTRDRIAFDLTTFTPINIGRTASTGLEAAYQGSLFSDLLDVRINYSLTKSVKRNESFAGDPATNKQLLFVPAHSANVSLGVHVGAVSLLVTQGTVGKRFVSDDHQKVLPEYHLTDLAISTAIDAGQFVLSATAEVRNLFDRSYQAFPDYPMPGRTFRVGAGIEY